MSYIIKSTTPFASTKLTDKGREKIAKGQLTFSSWAIGDSEINYDREDLVQDGSVTGTTKVLRPKDKNPDLRYVISNSSGVNQFNFGNADIKCLKVTIDNEADERGFFNGELSTGFTTNTTLTGYTNAFGTIASNTISGGTSIDIGVTGATEGDFLLLKTGYSGYTNETPEPHLWFKVQGVAGTAITVDRTLPNFSAGTTTFFVYKGGEIYDNEPDSVAYWDTGTLSFDASCDITVLDVPIWNMNIPYSDDVIGTTGTTEYEKHVDYGSYDYLGEKENYLTVSSLSLGTTTNNQAQAIIHYSNKTISNLYGEFLYIDGVNKSFKLHLPNLMYHRRAFSGSTTGDKMGMTFLASGGTVTESTGLVYNPLIEDATLVTGTPKQVGKVFPDLKIAVIDDPEVIAAMSYKSNRNWSLPKLDLTLVNPSTGVGTGALGVNETMYVTYTLDNTTGNGIAPTMPNQDFAVITNSTSSSQDVQFNIEDVNYFPFMQNDNVSGGFYADSFKVLFQIVTAGNSLEPELWKEIDFSSSVSGGTYIDVTTLESQNPLAVTPNFQLTQANTTGATTYSIIDTLTMPPSASPDLLQFGDERFFYGNIETFIGATIYKTLFKISLNASDFTATSNTTRSTDLTTNPPNIKVSEVGIYDSDGDLVIISKLSDPVELAAGKTVILELSMDF